MAVPINLFTRHTSVGVKVQGDYLTEAVVGADSTWAWLDCEVIMPDAVSLGREQEDYVRPNSAVGAVSPPIVGGRFGGEITIKSVMQGQLSTPWAVEDNAVASPTLALYGDSIGANATVEFVTVNMGISAGVDVVVTASGSYEMGCLLVWADDAASTFSTTGGMGWMVTAPLVTTVTLAAAPAQDSAAADTSWSSINYWMSLDQPTPRTIRIPGHDEDWDFRAVSCIPSSSTISLMPGMPPSVSITYQYADWNWDMGDGGGVRDPGDHTTSPPTSYVTMPAITAANGARFLIDGAAYTRGFGAGVEITVENTIDYFKGGGLEGYSAVVIPHKEVTFKFQVPIQDSDLSGDYLSWTNKFTAATAFSFQFDLGNTAGQVMSVYAPVLHVSEQPQLVTVGNETVGLEITAKLGVPTADATGEGVATCENTTFRIAIA